jgi:hypothetical protein
MKFIHLSVPAPAIRKGGRMQSTKQFAQALAAALLAFWLCPATAVAAQGSGLEGVVPCGHRAPVTSVAFSPDGRVMVQILLSE